ncbi:hypothetical protein GobsT_63950 [Gemmata obscuriglobus]|uniref:Uncharacterized protein n=1 Tax=Gemmata obscuriglobus TaxID=114 RepID=A0A2Z3GRD9_9BACT|nr:hypothetical protein [Gemmata obscuriglobus]AWM35878.1 hypothetical protein C1280_01830 [Gemmata obscuriglobus]QEG31573.1 hypothetical protein GobsT_63950 [Gemmata obscuriglobus]VTS10915.1 unnamed protein product [Gemmata obscuriglobus UQM 2246]
MAERLVEWTDPPPMHPHRANPAFLYEEGSGPVWCHYLAYALRESEEHFAVLLFCCEDSDVVSLTSPAADKHPYRTLGLIGPRFFRLLDSPRQNGYDLYHLLCAFPQRTIEVVCMTYAVLESRIAARSSVGALLAVVAKQAEPGAAPDTAR